MHLRQGESLQPAVVYRKGIGTSGKRHELEQVLGPKFMDLTPSPWTWLQVHELDLKYLVKSVKYMVKSST